MLDELDLPANTSALALFVLVDTPNRLPRFPINFYGNDHMPLCMGHACFLGFPIGLGGIWRIRFILISMKTGSGWVTEPCDLDNFNSPLDEIPAVVSDQS